MLVVFVIAYVSFWSDNFNYSKSMPMPIEACQEWVKRYNINKYLVTNFAYCEPIK